MKKLNIRNSMKIMCVLLVLGLSACQAQEAGVQRYAWPLGTSSPEDTVTHLYALKFVTEVARLSDGKMLIDIYPNGTIGGDRELLETCEEGDIPFVVQNTAPQVSFMPEMAVFDLPCVFDNIEAAREAVDNQEFYQEIQKVYDKRGYRLLGIADQGFRVMTSNTMVLQVPDFKGQKIRTMENANHLAFWQVLGANPTPMAFSEVYIGLQQKTIDAQENPYEVIASAKLYEQQKYVIQTNHLPHYICLFMNAEFYQNLSGEQQQIIDEAAANALVYAREQADIRVTDRIKVMEDSHTEIIDLPDEVRAEMRELSKGLYEKIRAAVGDSLADAYIGK